MSVKNEYRNDMVSVIEGIKIVDMWLDAKFQGGRHQARIAKIETEKVKASDADSAG